LLGKHARGKKYLNKLLCKTHYSKKSL